MTRKSLNVPPASRQAGARAQGTEFDGAVDLRGVSTEKIDFDAGMLSTRHVAALRSNAAPQRERLRESPFFQRRVRREREFLRPIAPIVTGAGESQRSNLTSRITF